MANRYVIKHSSAVQISNKINLLQRRAWNILLANAYEDLIEQEEYKVNIRELMDALGLEKSKNLEYLKDILRSLVSTSIEWNILGKDEQHTWEITTLLSMAVIQSGYLIYSYAPRLRRKLYNPNIYARISLSMQNKFDSKHTLALYELCIDYYIAKRGCGYTPTIPLDVFKRLLGFGEETYTNFKDLNKTVIKPSIKEINEKSDIHVIVEFEKKNKEVCGIRFTIEPNKENKNIVLLTEIPKEESAPDIKIVETVINDELYNKLVSCGLTAKQANDILNTKEESVIRSHLKYIKEKNNVANPGGYAWKVFQERIVPEAEVKKEERKKEENKLKQEQYLKEEYEKYKMNEIDKYMQSLSVDEKSLLKDDALKKTHEKYKDILPSNKAMAETLIRMYCRLEEENIICLKIEIPHFEEWVVNNKK